VPCMRYSQAGRTKEKAGAERQLHEINFRPESGVFIGGDPLSTTSP
jgi:hypothetical protein